MHPWPHQQVTCGKMSTGISSLASFFPTPAKTGIEAAATKETSRAVVDDQRSK